MKPEYIKPKTKHKGVCVPVKVEPYLMDTMVYSYCDLISQELYLPTLNYGFKVLLFILISFGVCCVFTANPDFRFGVSVWLYWLLWLLMTVYSISRYWHFTAEYRIRKIQKVDTSKLKCYMLKIDKRYMDWLEMPTLHIGKYRVHVDKCMYKYCRANSSIVVYTLDNKVVFWYPALFIRELSINIHSFDDIVFKIRINDVLNYYKVGVKYIFEIIQIVIKEVKEYCILIIKKLKRK